MNRLTKLLCTLLSILMLVAVFSACDDQGKGGLEATTTTTPTPGCGGWPPPNEDTYDENGYLNDHIDRESIDYGDQIVNVLAWEQNKELLFPEAMLEGEALSNEVYLRNRQMEADLGIKFNPTFKVSHMSSGDDAADLYNEALEGTTRYTAIVCFSLYPAKMVIEGILTDLTTLQFPEVDMPWYPEGVKTWGVYNRLFFVANNSSVQNILAS